MNNKHISILVPTVILLTIIIYYQCYNKKGDQDNLRREYNDDTLPRKYTPPEVKKLARRLRGKIGNNYGYVNSSDHNDKYYYFPYIWIDHTYKSNDIDLKLFYVDDTEYILRHFIKYNNRQLHYIEYIGNETIGCNDISSNYCTTSNDTLHNIVFLTEDIELRPLIELREIDPELYALYDSIE